MSNIKGVTVTKETRLDIHIPAHMLTDQALAEFSSYMFHVETAADLYRYVASMLAARPYPHLIEGVGPAEFMTDQLSEAWVSFRVIDTDIETVFTGGTVSAPVEHHHV